MALSGAQRAELEELLAKFDEYSEETRSQFMELLSTEESEKNTEVKAYKSLVIQIERLMQQQIFSAPTFVQDSESSPDAYDGDDEKSSQDSDITMSGSSDRRSQIKKIK
ncbi:hypothetical protein [Candidatus Berkiella aquae]|uniref:Uncharacterized protein n=1 Tax=Candidatus Berkiella aquae TaxID=295108 RepID=A0A0Q9YB54_9GAMM|nr:hypothetical protein [Candidatus Berkiella aquae]MCS5710615.1 hypothetical protein [Candidatus Berkiella aquae]